MERDPIYIAEQVKFIRKMHRLTQENLADAAGVSRRTIEKIESGRHRPDEQTIRSIARATQLDASFFEKPTPEQETRQRADIDRALSKMVVVPTNVIRSAGDFLGAFGQHDGLSIDTSAIDDDAALGIAAEMADWLTDVGDVWEDSYMSQRLDYAREFVKLCKQIEDLGYLCHMGTYRQQLRQRDRPRLIFTVGLMTVLARDHTSGTRYAMVKLEGAWESVEEERPSCN